MGSSAPEEVWRREAPHVLGALARRYGDWGDCEDAVQEALLAAHDQWPAAGVPEHPRGWLVRVASRRLVDVRRSRAARESREESWADPPGEVADDPVERDDTLDVLLLCCHPVLTPASQVALTLRAVAGLTTAQVAAAFFVPEATMAQRISRAKKTLREHGVGFGRVDPAELPDRLTAALRVLYLVFTEGHTASAGEDLVDGSLASEALRLARDLHTRLPYDDEVTGLLALMLLTHARRPGRVDGAGDLVPLAEQDRSLWDAAAIREGAGLVEQVLPRGHVGRYQLQAAIAAVHAEAATFEETDWVQVVALYRMLAEHFPDPTVTLNLAVAVAAAMGPEAGLAELAPLLDDPALAGRHRVHAVRAHLLEESGSLAGARASYSLAARLATNAREQRYLNGRLAALDRQDGGA
ncbi:RNA polymerase sigma factor, sigma-70 family [Nocardioides exalbidus]|uniref:RNA polymerase sigma factor, sigma-70 family n=1 Tax=Nocardioides exalbidus TaxID=402596 RepID=A0A1H4NTX6_9ACTN|nr:sigma-70 family RNA polymerase sigma factor [Nocardioides exalbidus]SEB98671.1 RNA polymerase sigma factor, sigma-70 family [Nocardioides exalbidus]